MKKSRILSIGLAALTLQLGITCAFGAPQLFKENFSGSIEKGSLFPTDPTPGQFNGWYAPRNHDDSVNGSRPHAWTWGLPNEKMNMAVTFQSRTEQGKQQWLLRDLTTGGPLPEGRTFTTPTLRALFHMGWGDNVHHYNYNLALLNNEGNGYVAQISRNGKATLYRLDNGLQGPWTILDSVETNLTFNTNLIWLTAENGKVTVASKLITQNNIPGPAVSSQDASYTDFTTIGISGLGTIDAIDVRVRDVVLEGIVAPAQ